MRRTGSLLLSVITLLSACASASAVRTVSVDSAAVPPAESVPASSGGSDAPAPVATTGTVVATQGTPPPTTEVPVATEVPITTVAPIPASTASPTTSAANVTLDSSSAASNLGSIVAAVQEAYASDTTGTLDLDPVSKSLNVTPCLVADVKEFFTGLPPALVDETTRTAYAGLSALPGIVGRTAVVTVCYADSTSASLALLAEPAPTTLFSHTVSDLFGGNASVQQEGPSVALYGGTLHQVLVKDGDVASAVGVWIDKNLLVAASITAKKDGGATSNMDDAAKWLQSVLRSTVSRLAATPLDNVKACPTPKKCAGEG